MPSMPFSPVSSLRISTPHGPQLKAAETLSVGDREAVFVASTDTLDRDGDVVEQNWDFSEFKKNPVLLFQHDADALPVGKVTRLWTNARKTKTYARAEAPPEGADETADKVWRFVKAGFLNAASVRYMPLEQPVPRRNSEGMVTGWTFPRSSLLELSVVSVPANPDALVVAKSLDFTDDDIASVFVQPSGVSARVKAAKRFAEIQRLRVS